MSALLKIDAALLNFSRPVKMWQQSARGIFSEVVLSSDGDSRSGMLRMVDNLRQSRSYHAGFAAPDEGGLLRSVVDDIIGDAQVDADHALSGQSLLAVSNFAEDIIQAVHDTVRDCMQGDENTIVSALRRLQIRQSLLASRKPPLGSAQQLKLTRTDAVGRQWSSATIARLEARSALTGIYNQTFMTALLESGTDLAFIGHGDGPGTVFSITGRMSGVPSLDDVEKHMHPNARYLVSRR